MCVVSHVTHTVFIGACLGLAACQSAPQTSRPPSTTLDATTPDARAFDAAAIDDDRGVSVNPDARAMDSDSGVATDVGFLADAHMGASDSGVLFGQRPASPLSLPTFMALNSDGSSRTQGDLLGHPTVMWFFPFAGTPG
jgi:hypothetical protein